MSEKKKTLEERVAELERKAKEQEYTPQQLAQLEKIEKAQKGSEKSQIEEIVKDLMQGVAETVVNSEEFKKNIEGLNSKLTKMEEDKKFAELKTEIAKLTDLLKTQRPSGETTAKDLINLMTVSAKKEADIKDEFFDQLKKLSDKQFAEMTAKRLMEKMFGKDD